MTSRKNFTDLKIITTKCDKYFKVRPDIFVSWIHNVLNVFQTYVFIFLLFYYFYIRFTFIHYDFFYFSLCQTYEALCLLQILKNFLDEHLRKHFWKHLKILVENLSLTNKTTESHNVLRDQLRMNKAFTY